MTFEDQECASTNKAMSPMYVSSERERRAMDVLLPTRQVPGAHQSASAAKLRRGRQAKHLMCPEADVPADQISASSARRDHRANADALPEPDPLGGQTSVSSAGRGRRASTRVQPYEGLRGGQLSDAPAPADGVGDDGGAHWDIAYQNGKSPAVVETSSIQARHETQDGADAGDDGSAQVVAASHWICSPTVVEIVQLWRMRQRWHRAEKSLILQGKAICRAWTAGDKTAADKLFTAASKNEAGDPSVDMALMPFLSAIDRFGSERAAIEKRLRKLSQASPLWPWVAEVKGFGPLNLAAVIGEAGEIAGYRNPSCLWKRMGLAVIDGGRQRRVADAEKALVHGYAPARRCVAYLLGDTLIKAGDACRYRAVYAARRERTAETHPDWTKAHSHNDGARIMVKRVLRDLWCEARRQSGVAEILTAQG